MNIIDIILVIPLAIGAYHGFRKGFVLEIVSLLALILGVIGGFHFLHWGIGQLTNNFNISGKFLPLLSFLLIFFGIIILVNLLGRFVKKVVHMALLGGVDRIAGAALGVIKWGFMFSILIWLITVFSLPVPEHLKEGSFLYSHIASIAPATVNLFSKILPFTNDLFDQLADLLSFLS